MKNGLKLMKTRAQLIEKGKEWRVPKKQTTFCEGHNFFLTIHWANYIKKQNPSVFISTQKAHELARAIVYRPSYISYMTAYHTAIADLGVQS